MVEEQIIQMETSPHKGLIEQLRQKGEKFVDNRFPPNNNSLSGEWKNVS